MRNLLLILAIGAMVYGGRRFHRENPHVWESVRDTLQLDRLGGKGGGGSDDRGETKRFKKSSKGGRTIATISTGSRVDTQSHAIESGYTIIEFTADW